MCIRDSRTSTAGTLSIDKTAAGFRDMAQRKKVAMGRHRTEWRGVCALAAGLLVVAAVGCGPTFPPAWLLEAEPSDASGVFDVDGLSLIHISFG